MSVEKFNAVEEATRWKEPEEVAMEQKPSIGRIVHYLSYGSVGGKYPPATRAAIVATDPDPSDGAVDLVVFNPEGFFFNRKVRFGSEPGTWHWPPRV